ncbi:phosphatase family protein [Mariannaea sp. PMI_226]|nr:phosphatase family protein [Mariannaea sp. PMI_226]
MGSQLDDSQAQPGNPEAVEFTPATTPQSLAKAVYARREEYTRPHQIKVKIGTWNVAACPGTDGDLANWFTEGQGIDQDFATIDLSKNSSVERTDPAHQDENYKPYHIVAREKIGLYVLGLQEIVDLNYTKDYVNRAMYTDTSTLDKWQAALEAALPSGYEMIMTEQMTGLLLLVYASPEVAATISNVSTKQVGTGLWGLGNKGAVSTRLLLGETTRMVFINSHLASGTSEKDLERRCWDAGQVVTKTQFDPIVISGVEDDEGEKIGDEDLAFWFGDLNFRLDGLPGDDIRRLLELHVRGEYGAADDKPTGTWTEEDDAITLKNSDNDDGTTTTDTNSSYSRHERMDSEITLPDPDDFPEDPSQDPTSLQATIDSLLPHDQLRRMIKHRKVFHDGWREGAISFLPTYKYDVGTIGQFDSSEKQRAPSWCDRILFRTRTDREKFEQKLQEEEEARKKDEEMKARGLEDDDDVLFSYDPDADGDEPASSSEEFQYYEYDENEDPEAEDILTKEGFHDRINLEIYASHQRISSSDHKPITSIFTLDYDAVVPELKQIVHAEVARELDRAENEGRPGITVIVEGGEGGFNGDDRVVDFGSVRPLERKTRSLTVANTSSVPATFSFVERPTVEEGEEQIKGWLKTSFVRADEDSPEPLGKSVTLEPGETVSILVEIQIYSILHIRALNEVRSLIEDVLVLRVEDGRDHFVPVRGTWQPTCLGRSISELIRVPDGGIIKFLKDNDIKGVISDDWPPHVSVPRELLKLTDAAANLVERSVADAAMLDDAALPQEAGWPVDPATWRMQESERQAHQTEMINALDTDSPLIESLSIDMLASTKLEVLFSVLWLFLESLTDGIIPAHLWTKLSAMSPNISSIPVASWPDSKAEILDILASAPNHNIAFVFLAATLSRIASELTPTTTLTRRISFRLGGEKEDTRRRRTRERRFAELVGPLVCRIDEKEKGAKDRARLVLEMFLRRDDGS